MRFAAALDKWLFRMPVREAAPIVLVQRRIFVLPTKAGLAFGGVLLLLLAGAINYNLSLGYALCFLLGSLGLVALLHTFRNLLNLSIAPGHTDDVFAGQAAHFRLLLTNTRPEPRYGIHAGLKGGEMQAADIPAGAQVRLALPFPAARRGWLRPGRVTLVTTYPLGLIRAWSYVAPELACLVYPAPENPVPPLPCSPGGLGDGRSAEAGRDDFAGLRSYRVSDSPRHIAWKALAGGGALLTKQFDGEGGPRLNLDWSELPVGMAVEARLSRLTAWLLEARRLGLPCSLCLPGFHRAPGGSEAHFHDCLKALALHGMDSPGAPPHPPAPLAQ